MGYPQTLGRERRRALGCYYTPPRIVGHLVKAALGPLLPGMCRAAAQWGVGEALKLRVLDPAMGDGTFLQAAADLIASRLARASCAPAGPIRTLVISRCLFGVDVDPAAVDLARARLSHGLEPDLPLPNIMCGDALWDEPSRSAGDSACRFDVVIGNPPWGGWNRRLDQAAKARYRSRFTTARGLLDPFALFLERSTELIASGGRLALVLPDYFLLKNYPAARRHVLEHYRIEELAHWGMAFPGVNLDACSIVARRAQAPRGPAKRSMASGSHKIRCLPEGVGARQLWVPQSRFADAPGHIFNLSLDSRAAALLSRLERNGARLGDWLEAHEGIHSGNIRSKLFLPPDRSGSVTGWASGAASLRPLILGREEIRPFRLAWGGWDVVYDRRVIARDRGEYASLGEERWFTSPKILVRRTGDRVIAAADRSGLFASNNLFVALPRHSCPVPLEYLEGYLNSSLATWCFRAIQPRAGRLFAELKLIHLNRFPVPRPEGRDPVTEARQIARIRTLVGHLRVLAADGASEASASALAELDSAFAVLAGLTPAQAALVARVARERRTARAKSPL